MFDPHSTNENVYRHCAKPLIDSLVKGYSATIFAYGQTGSGKTYTMFGVQPDLAGNMPVDKQGNVQDRVEGVFQLALNDLYEQMAEQSERNWLVTVSFCQIYKEKVTDLLAEDDRDKPLKLFGGDARTKPFVRGLSEYECKSKEEVLRYMQTGIEQRHVGANDVNHVSSRSHAVFKLVLESTVDGSSQATPPATPSSERSRPSSGQRRKTPNSAKRGTPSTGRRTPPAGRHGTKTGQPKKTKKKRAGDYRVLYIVDLAGNETVKELIGIARSEGISINKSLSSLNRAIRSASEGGVVSADSTLVKLLRKSIGGDTATSVICAAHPNPEHTGFTKRTIEFGAIAGKITVDPKKAELQGKLAAVMENQAKFKRDLARARKEKEARVAELQHEMAKLVEEHRRKEAEMAAEAEMLREETKNVVNNQLQERLDEEAAAKSALQDQLASVRAAMDGMRQDKLALEKQLRDAQARKSQVEEEQAAARRQLEQQQAANLDLEAKLTEQRAKIEEAEAAASEREAVLLAEQQQLREASDKVASKLQEQESRNAALQDELERQRAQQQEVERAQRDNQTRLQAMQQATARAQSKLDESHRQLQDQEELTSALQQQLVHEQSKIAETKRSLDATQRELAAAQEEFERQRQLQEEAIQQQRQLVRQKSQEHREHLLGVSTSVAQELHEHFSLEDENERLRLRLADAENILETERMLMREQVEAVKRQERQKKATANDDELAQLRQQVEVLTRVLRRHGIDDPRREMNARRGSAADPAAPGAPLPGEVEL